MEAPRHVPSVPSPKSGTVAAMLQDASQDNDDGIQLK